MRAASLAGGQGIAPGRQDPPSKGAVGKAVGASGTASAESPDARGPGASAPGPSRPHTPGERGVRLTLHPLLGPGDVTLSRGDRWKAQVRAGLAGGELTPG